MVFRLPDGIAALALLTLTLACASSPEPETAAVPPDPHSAARPAAVVVRHIALDLAVDFERRVLTGSAELMIDNVTGADTLHLDTRDLEIAEITLEPGGRKTEWALAESDPLLGRPLAVAVTPETESVRIVYATSPDAAALQWLSPTQTAGGQEPFLFTQSQAILARTWVPCQDTPAVRFTYNATVRVPRGLMALMSAENGIELAADGVYRFQMPQAIPSYLLALAVGDLEFRSLGPRSGVYAEPSVVEAAAWEFAEVEPMIDAAESLYGPYRWGRYDLLVLPPSFPFGGMENPRLTFATPTIIAGDRSLVALVAHELAHSWSGNLVTNATWNDFWLNEGFTSYIENRIMEEIKGAEYAEMLRALSLQDLTAEIDDLGAGSVDTHLELDLAGRDPDDGMNSVAYDKGAALLRLFEETVGRERWDAFLAAYFDAHAFQSLDTATFVAYLEERLPEAAAEVGLERWIHGPGLPDNHPRPASEAFAAVDAQIEAWSGGARAASLPTASWTTHEWLHFLRNLPPGASHERLAELDRAYKLSDSGNAEILTAWLVVSIRDGYEAARPALESFLTRVGRRKFLKPLYEELARTEEGRAWALEVYERARPGYHAISSGTIDLILGWPAAATES